MPQQLDSVSLVLNGTKYNLVYDFNALVALEQATGRNLLDGSAWDLTKFNGNDVRSFFWAGLLADHPEITIIDAGKLLDMKTIGPVFEAIGKAWGISLPKKPAAPAVQEDSTSPPPLRGTISGASVATTSHSRKKTSGA
jgi:hypothetical protein